jgi:preprotein translocase subunit Sec61beta
MGRLLADLAVLADTPFSDWRVPGVLLAGLVGGGFLLAGWWQWRGHRYARELSMIAGAGLVFFEAAELGWIGFQPLEAVFAAVGVSIIGLMRWRLPGRGSEVTASGEEQAR